MVAYEILDHFSSLACNNSKDLPMFFKNVYLCEKSISRKNPLLATEKFPSLVPLGNAMLQQLLMKFPPSYLTIGRLQEFKSKKVKMVAVAYERWPLIIGSKYMYSPENVWFIAKLVAEERRSLARGGRNQAFNCNYSRQSGDHYLFVKKGEDSHLFCKTLRWLCSPSNFVTSCQILPF